MGTILLKIGGGLSCAVALLHIIIIFIGAPGFRYFGAGEEMARLAASGSLMPAAITFGIAVVFVLCGFYAFSGAGMMRPLPRRKTVLSSISAVFILRGISVFPQIFFKIKLPDAVPPRFIAFSAAALLIGIFYLAGTLKSWKNLQPQA